MGTMTDRIAQLTRLLEMEPNDAFCLYGLAQEYAKAGRPEDAIGYFDRAIAADPSMSYAYFHKARSQESVEDVAGAIATLERGLAAAKKAGDGKAVSEIAGYLDALT